MGTGGAYWLDLGELEAVRILDYTGDGTNNRQIDLGDVYDEVEIRTRENKAATGGWVVQAWALREIYGVLHYASNALKALAGVTGAALWKGFTAGRDKVDLGTDGSANSSTNASGERFRLRAKKFRSVRS